MTIPRPARALLALAASCALLPAAVRAQDALEVETERPYAEQIGRSICSAGLTCTGPEGTFISSEDMRLVEGFRTEDEAIEEITHASHDISDQIWLCAASGPCDLDVFPDVLLADLGLTEEQVGYVIQLRPDLAAQFGSDRRPDISGAYFVDFTHQFNGALRSRIGDTDGLMGLSEDGGPWPIVVERSGDEVRLTFPAVSGISPGPYVFGPESCSMGGDLCASAPVGKGPEPANVARLIRDTMP